MKHADKLREWSKSQQRFTHSIEMSRQKIKSDTYQEVIS